MKKFFKALALVLALTLVLGTIPASAAVDADKVRKEKTLYVDGTKGFKTVDGEKQESLLKARTTYWKLLKIKKAEAKTLEVTAESSAPEIVKVNDKSMGVHVYGIGKATVKLIVEGKVYNVAITAKKSAETVTFGRDFEDTEKAFYAGKTYEISLPRTVNGVKLDTDERRLFVKNEKGEIASAEEVTITADATAPRLWTVKFLKAGKYTVIGEAFQSKKYDGTTASYEATIEVKTPVLASVKQTALNKAQLVFDGDANAVDMSTFKEEDIYYIVKDSAGNESVVPFSLTKSVKVNADDATLVDVEMYSPFEGGREYFFVVGDVTVSFVASGTKAIDVEKIVITTSKVEFGDFRDIDYKLVNADGIDIRYSVDCANLVPVFELVSGNTNDVMVASTQIYFYEKNKTATIKGSLTTDWGNEANGYTPKVVYSDPTEIVSTDVPQASYTGVSYSFEKPFDISGDRTKLGTNHDFAIGDNSRGTVLNILFKYRNAENTGDFYKTLEEEGIVRVAAADENFLVVTSLVANDNNKASYVTVEGIKSGAATLIFYKNNADGQEYPCATAAVTVKPQRGIKTVTLSADKTMLNTEAGINDEVKLTLTVKDNYDQLYAINTGDIVVSQTDQNIAAVGKYIGGFAWTAEKDGVYNCTISNSFTFATALKDTTKGGNAVFKARIADKIDSNNVGITFADKTNAKATLVLNLSGATLDTAVKEDTKTSKVTFTVVQSKSGFYGGLLDNVSFIGKKAFTDKKAASTDYVYTVTLNGEMLETLKANMIDAVEATGCSITAVSPEAIGAKAKKLDEGNYVFTLYEKKTDSKGATYYTGLGSKTLVVKNSQIPATWEKKNDTSTITSTTLTYLDKKTIVDETIKLFFNGKEHNDYYYDSEIVVSADGSYFIKKVTIKVPNDEVGYVLLDVTPNKLINGTNK